MYVQSLQVLVGQPASQLPVQSKTPVPGTYRRSQLPAVVVLTGKQKMRRSTAAKAMTLYRILYLVVGTAAD